MNKKSSTIHSSMQLETLETSMVHLRATISKMKIR